MYASPRDRTVSLKIQHRNLRVAKHGGMETTNCTGEGCQEDETQEHLVACPVLARFWKQTLDDMIDIGLLTTENKPLTAEERLALWIAHQMVKNRPAGSDPEDENDTTKFSAVNREASAYICWAWRAIYAEITRARLNSEDFNQDQANRDTIRLAYSRVKAHGARWKRWFNKQRLWSDDTSKMVPEEHQDYICIQCDHKAEYEINGDLEHLQRTRVRGRTRKV